MVICCLKHYFLVEVCLYNQKTKDISLHYDTRDWPFNLQGEGYGFLFRSENYFRTTQELEYLFFLLRKAQFFFPEFNIRLYDKKSESDYFFFLHHNQNIFFSNIGNQNIFSEKNHNPPFKLNGLSLSIIYYFKLRLFKKIVYLYYSNILDFHLFYLQIFV